LPEDLYEEPRSKVSQGDILDDLPHLSLEKPLLALYKEAETLFRAAGEPFTQFDDKNGQPVVGICSRARAVVISPDCEIDKSQVKKWIVCRIKPASSLRPQVHDHLKRNRIYSMLFLPRFRDSLPDSYVDFNTITTLDSALVTSAKRIVSLSDIGRRGLYLQFIRWLTRWEFRDLTCPNCAASFNPADVLPVRTE
jgi:hypothetical protein